MATRLATILSRVSTSGGQPIGTIAVATGFLITDTASPSRNICTVWPASERARPCRNGNADLVGSSEPQALFIMMLSLRAGCGAAAAMPRKGKASAWDKKDRRAISLLGCVWWIIYLTSEEAEGALAATAYGPARRVDFRGV